MYSWLAFQVPKNRGVNLAYPKPLNVEVHAVAQRKKPYNCHLKLRNGSALLFMGPNLSIQKCSNSALGIETCGLHQSAEPQREPPLERPQSKFVPGHTGALQSLQQCSIYPSKLPRRVPMMVTRISIVSITLMLAVAMTH